jgi:hypothetical protein
VKKKEREKMRECKLRIKYMQKDKKLKRVCEEKNRRIARG